MNISARCIYYTKRRSLFRLSEGIPRPKSQNCHERVPLLPLERFFAFALRTRLHRSPPAGSTTAQTVPNHGCGQASAWNWEPAKTPASPGKLVGPEAAGAVSSAAPASPSSPLQSLAQVADPVPFTTRSGRFSTSMSGCTPRFSTTHLLFRSYRANSGRVM